MESFDDTLPYVEEILFTFKKLYVQGIHSINLDDDEE
jgi:hypothetical protein